VYENPPNLKIMLVILIREQNTKWSVFQCFTHFISFNPWNNITRERVLLLPFYKQNSWGYSPHTSRGLAYPSPKNSLIKIWEIPPGEIPLKYFSYNPY
jgi:hypothetical protein